MPNKNLEAAIDYREKYHFSVFPVNGATKKPLVKWTPYQTRLPEQKELERWWREWPDANIGAATGAISGVDVIDADDQAAYDRLNEFLPQSLEIPTAKTPRGWHNYFEHAEGVRNSQDGLFDFDIHVRGDGGYIILPPSERNGQSYKWLLDPKDVQPPPMPAELLSYIKNNSNKEYANDITSEMFIKGRLNDDFFHVAWTMLKGGAKPHEIGEVLKLIARGCGLNNEQLTKRKIQEKIDCALKRLDRKERNLTREIREYILGTEGLFSNEEIYRTLSLNNREEKTKSRVILARLVEEGVIERQRKKDGVFRRVEDEAELIDYKAAAVETVPVLYPFGIQELVHTYPGNLITVAGTINSGKTAFLLNLTALNMRSFRVKYFSSEMGPSEMKVRLKKFENVPFNEWCFEARERSSNFADIIRPTSQPTIWVIDFLELLDEFWKVGMQLKDIHDKLSGSHDVAVIALQKAPGTDVGRGGAFGLEKPRLALAMESGKIKVVKAKNWRSEKNPNGLYKEYALVGGCKIVDESHWFYDDGKLFKK